MVLVAILSIWLGYGMAAVAMGFGLHSCGAFVKYFCFIAPYISSVCIMQAIRGTDGGWWVYKKTMFIKIAGIWLGYGLAVAAMAFGTHSCRATLVVGFLGGLFAAIAVYRMVMGGDCYYQPYK